MRLGVGTKESPRDNTLISESESCTIERLMTICCWSGEVVFFFWERVLLSFLWTLLGLIVLLPVVEVFIDRVLVLCAAWLEVFVEGVSGYMHCVVRRRGSSDTHCVFFFIMEYIF